MTNDFEPVKNIKNHQLSNGSWLLYTNHKGGYEVHILGGISDIEKSFSISETMVDEFMQDKRDEGELLYAAKYGTWPLPKAEQEEYYEEHGINDMLSKIKKESEQNWSDIKKE